MSYALCVLGRTVPFPRIGYFIILLYVPVKWTRNKIVMWDVGVRTESEIKRNELAHQFSSWQFM